MPVSEAFSQIDLRWRRMILRMRERFQWSAKGVLLWLLPRSSLRYLPLPYPATSTLDKWEAQCRVQVMEGVVSKRHTAKAQNSFTYENLGDCIHLRNRMGLDTAFCEDPVLQGFKLAKSAKGLSQRVKSAALAEAKQKAQEAEHRGEQDELARALIGPRGGLPTLRKDLIRLAALLNVEIQPTDNVEQIKEKVKPMVALLKETKTAAKAKPQGKTEKRSLVPQGATSSGSSSRPPPATVPWSQVQEMQGKFQSALDNMALELQELRAGRIPQQPVDLTSLMTEPSLMTDEDMMHMRNPMGYGLSQGRDVSMEEAYRTDPEFRQEVNMSLEQDWEAKLAAHYGEDYYLLTQEEMEAWNQHEQDRRRVSQAPKKIKELLETEYYEEMKSFLDDEIFVQPIDLNFKVNETLMNDKVSSNDQPLVTEIYTSARNVTQEAKRRGHKVGTSMSLDNGWNFLLRRHREAAIEKVKTEKPFCVVLAFPCGPFSPLQFLNKKGHRSWPARLHAGRILMKFALEIARIQMSEGRHCILENPKPSLAWSEPEMKRFLEEENVFPAVFDQCRFGLRSVSGDLRKKPTQVVSSSSCVTSMLDGVCCMRDHSHTPVLGGSRITAPAGLYPRALARTLVRGLEAQFEKDFKPCEVLVAGVHEDDGDQVVAVRGEIEDNEASDEEFAVSPDEKKLVIPGSVKATIRRLHENTGHRSNTRLARALTLAGAPLEAIVAAKRHQCAVCQERKPPK
ncbi:unnamed protein product, partial [Durusdinium trenchii]